MDLFTRKSKRAEKHHVTATFEGDVHEPLITLPESQIKVFKDQMLKMSKKIEKQTQEIYRLETINKQRKDTISKLAKLRDEMRFYVMHMEGYLSAYGAKRDWRFDDLVSGLFDEHKEMINEYKTNTYHSYVPPNPSSL